MKRLSYLLLFSGLSLTACKKKYCWECTTETTGGATVTSATNTYCDITEDDIRDKEGTSTSQITTGVKTITVTNNTVCVKKD